MLGRVSLLSNSLFASADMPCRDENTGDVKHDNLAAQSLGRSVADVLRNRESIGG